MDHVIVKLASSMEIEEMGTLLATTKDGDLFDHDVLNHESTFSLCAVSSEMGRHAYLPVQQPLMLENLIFRPGLSERQTAVAMTRLAEYAIGEAYRRDVGEIYFLCRDDSTCRFAERHKFKSLAEIDPNLKVYRLNLLETFGS
jgi:hypothetical protein